MLIDTHAHLFSFDFAQDKWPGSGGWEGVIQRAKAAGVKKIIVPGTDAASSAKAIEMAREYPGTIYAAVGIHPEELLNNQAPITNNQTRFNDQILQLIQENREQVVAVGEIGIDLYGDAIQSTLLAQKELFRMQSELAIEFDLPVIIHTRNSFAETWEVLSGLPKMPRGQFHCFSGTEEELSELLERGYYVSFCGNISWSKRVRRMTAIVPVDRLLLETDSPFMVPRNIHGEPVSPVNEPSRVRMLAEILAETRGISVATLEEQTTANVHTLFDI